MSSTKKKTTASERRPKVANYYLKGWSQYKIADALGTTQATVSRDLKVLRKEWLQSALRDFDTAKAQELVKIDKLEAEYWELFEDSKEPFKKTVQKGRKAGKDNAAPIAMEQTVITEERIGDKRYLEGVQWCIEQRCKILGVYAAAKVDLTWREKVNPEKKALALGFFGELAAKMAEQMEGDGD